VRLLFLLLLAANLGFFAWTHFLASPDPAVDRQPLARQLGPHRLRIVTERELVKAPAPASAKPAPAPVAPEPARIACLEWGSFSPADATRAAQRLEPLAGGARRARERGGGTARGGVGKPPPGSPPQTQRPAAGR
jgi:hypothetical protein